ncbi:(4Fe-4S)-binding protein [Elizabethkingia anophelis]|nr:(4Fe-4S)-binding protein [Elizabethkingia anophelis]MDV3842080.1 (4Fe-4S)-binding protein [Elizabethkingia anophelis]
METREYTKNKNITILWTPEKCVHAGICVKSLPQVYHPKEKPWITPDGVSTEVLKSQIDKCPTGALGYKINENTK